MELAPFCFWSLDCYRCATWPLHLKLQKRALIHNSVHDTCSHACAKSQTQKWQRLDSNAGYSLPLYYSRLNLASPTVFSTSLEKPGLRISHACAKSQTQKWQRLNSDAGYSLLLYYSRRHLDSPIVFSTSLEGSVIKMNLSIFIENSHFNFLSHV